MENVLYVKKLMTQIFKKPYYRQRADNKAAILRIQDKNLYHFLLSIGLKSGNKMLNQVNVPDWIKSKKDLIISCLRGLFDTDGNISLDKRYDSLKLTFRNHSEPLLLDFRKMTEAIGVNPSERGYNRVQIQFKRDMMKFIEIVEPIKWKVKLK